QGCGRNGARPVLDGRRWAGRGRVALRIGRAGRSADGSRAHGADAEGASGRRLAVDTPRSVQQKELVMRPVPLQELRTRVASLHTAALLAAGALGLAACASSAPATGSSQPVPSTSEVVPFAAALRTVPSPDPRVGLRAGL